MPTALDQLLARPSALKLLRTILNSSEPGPPSLFASSREGPCKTSNGIKTSGTRFIHSTSTRQARSENAHNGQSLGSEDTVEFKGVRYQKKIPNRVWNRKEEQQERQEEDVKTRPRSRKLIRYLKVKHAPILKPDYAWWAQLLQTRQSLHGSLGVRESWFGMRRYKIDLPTTGEHAEFFWSTFLSDNALLDVIVQYAILLHERTGRYYSLLYEKILQRRLASDPKTALRMHLVLMTRFHLPRTFPQSIALTLPPDRAVLRVIRAIYLDTNQEGVYDPLITNLLGSGQLNLAMEWHRFLVDRHEIPSRRVSILFRNQTRKIETAKIAKATRAADNATIPLTQRHLGREAVYNAMGEAHSVKPKEISDSFCAKIFATRFLTVGTIIRGLGGFGVRSIGPLALREMALRLENCKEIIETLGDLAIENVEVRKCVFAAAVERFATDNRDDLMTSLLQSDQHPDVLEDRLLQSQLLEMYISNKDYKQAERTLHILSLFHEDRPTEAWNKLFRDCIRNTSLHDLEPAEQIFQDMMYHRIPMTFPTHIALRNFLLRPRRHGKRPIALPAGFREPGPDTLFVTNCLLRLLKTGQRVSPKVWGDILLRMGMALPLDELERLCMWLVAYHHHDDAVFHRRQRRDTSKQIRALTLPRFKPGGDIAAPLYTILNRHALRAIIAWGFRATMARRRRAPDPDAWTKGLEMVCMFRDRGMVVHASMVKAELRRRFMMLFGSERPRHRWGKQARLTNPFTLGHLVRECERIWGSHLFLNRGEYKGSNTSQAQDELPSEKPLP